MHKSASISPTPECLDQLSVLENGSARDITPAELFRAGEVLSGKVFPLTQTLHVPPQVGMFAQWCLAPLQTRDILLVMLGSSIEVVQYRSLDPQGALETIDALLDMRIPGHPINYAYIVLARPPSYHGPADPERDAVEEQIKHLRSPRVSHLRVLIDGFPPALPTSGTLEGSCQRILLRGRPAAPHEVMRNAQAWSARSWQRGQTLATDAELRWTAQLCSGTLRRDAVSMMLFDRENRFIDYAPVCQGGIDTAMPHAQAMTERIMRFEADSPVLVYSQTGPRAALNALELESHARLLTRLSDFGVRPRSFVVVGTDGAAVKHLHGSHRPVTGRSDSATLR